MNPETETSPSLVQPHAFHLNLPPHFRDKDGVPLVTKFAEKKARQAFDLAMSIELKASFFEFHDEQDQTSAPTTESMDIDEESALNSQLDEDDEAPLPSGNDSESLLSVKKRCARLFSMCSALDNLKFGGLTLHEIMDVTLQLLRLVSATVSYEGQGLTRKATLHYDTVGAVLHFGEAPAYESKVSQQGVTYTVAESRDGFKEEMKRPFALPSPCRETLLLVLINIISNKGPLRPVSNASVYTSDESNRSLLILHWKPFLRMLLRTAPYLDEYSCGDLVIDSNSRMNTVLKRTVQLIRDARHFFEQGVRPKGHEDSSLIDQTSIAVWSMVESDILFRSASNACFRGSILLYLFHPTRCSEQYYLSVLPKWWDAWTNIDRCPEYDHLWLSLFCRARKVTVNYDWAPIRKRLLTLSQYWLQLPLGGGSLDKSFPRAGNPRSRSYPSRLKPFIGSGSSYSDGLQLATKISKLLVAGLGTGNVTGGSDGPGVSDGTRDVLRFFSFVAPYFNPSNVGQWTFALGAFLHNFSYEFCCRIGTMAGQEALAKTHPKAVEAFGREQPIYEAKIPVHEIALMIDSMLPLCQQALYSKSGHVGRAGEAAMLYLVQVDPEHVTPSFLDFSSRALDISAVNLSHQAPVALSVLARLVQPGLRSNPAILFSRLPQILGLTLAGIDSNDKNKTIRTLIFYRSLTSWVSVGSYSQISAAREAMEEDGTMILHEGLFETVSTWRKSREYADAIDRLPLNSLMHQETLDASEYTDEVGSVMSDWALEFLERIFGLLRGSGETEKASKRASGVAKHSSADVLQARNFCRVLKECMIQFFVSMDDETYQVALRQLVRFIEEETLPSANKEAACLCQAAAAMRNKGHSPGLDALIPILTDDISHHSVKTVVYRIRCLAGAVRLAGDCVLKHQAALTSVMQFCMTSEDKHVFKTGCKLLRHTVATCAESFPFPFGAKPRYFDGMTTIPCMGRSAQMRNDEIQWHIPNDELQAFAVEILQAHVLAELDALVSKEKPKLGFLSNASDLNRVRRFLRIVRYSLRGGSSLLLDFEALDSSADDFVPFERACLKVITESNRNVLLCLRSKLCTFVAGLASFISADNFFPKELDSLDAADPRKETVASIAADQKICNEVCDIAALLLTRRGSGFRSQEARSIWKAQMQLASDFLLCATADHISEVLQCASLYGECQNVLCKDGEDAGKTVPRRLLQARMKIFHDFLQRSASFEIPRRLRRLSISAGTSIQRHFLLGDSLSSFLDSVETSLSSGSSPIDAYERLTDGLYALSCHTNSQVRSSAVSVVDYSSTRFGWLVSARIHRLLSALALDDADTNGKFGVPSCSKLSEFSDTAGKRKLSEGLKGVCSILMLSRHMKQLLQTEKSRCQLVETLFCAEKVTAMLPGEEMQKFVHYLQALFSGFRSKIYSFPRVVADDVSRHNALIQMALSSLSENSAGASIDVDELSIEVSHWRKKLLSCWVLLTFLDDQDYTNYDEDLIVRVWTTCFHTIETETGQPLQRVALGLLGRLVQFPMKTIPNIFEAKLTCEAFCQSLGEALVYDHKEDTSVGSGQESQWAFGVEDYIRDAARNIAPRTLFPFPRTSQAFGAFKPSHSQLIVSLLRLLDRGSVSTAETAVQHLLNFAKSCAGAPPSEDYRNQQAAAAEIFAAVCRYHLEIATGNPQETFWTTVLLPHLDDVINKIPFSLSGAYFDAIRFSLQFCPAETYLPLTFWLGTKIEETLWQLAQQSNASDPGNSVTAASSDSFTAQSKWLYLFSAVLIEMSETTSGPTRWYQTQLYGGDDDLQKDPTNFDLTSWDYTLNTILPLLFGALSHPFDSCRDHIARVLFRICYECTRREELSTKLSELPIVDRFVQMEAPQNIAAVDRLNGLSTMRRFVSYSVHLGESKFEYSSFILKLLSVAFGAIGSKFSTAEVDSEDQVALRAMETEVAKSYRSLLAEVSVTSVISYGATSDMVKLLDLAEVSGKSSAWQVRHAAAHFLRCVQSVHQFVFAPELTVRSLELIASMLSDDRREVSSAATAALTGVLAVAPVSQVADLVEKYRRMAGKSKLRRQKKQANGEKETPLQDKDAERALNQKTSVFFLCAAVMAHPYETPPYVPVALAAISKHSFERNAPLAVREVVKRCCAEYKKTHMSDDWERHRKVFSTEELEALEDVISSPHYYA